MYYLIYRTFLILLPNLHILFQILINLVIIYLVKDLDTLEYFYYLQKIVNLRFILAKHLLSKNKHLKDSGYLLLQRLLLLFNQNLD